MTDAPSELEPPDWAFLDDPSERMVLAVKIANVIDRLEEGDTIEEDRAAYDAAQLAENLDNWLSNGGFLPTAWEDGRND